MADDIIKRQEAIARAMMHLADRVFPVKAGAIALRFVQDNFRQGGFVDGGLHPWQTTKRQMRGGKSAASKYSPLMSSRKNLFSGTNYTPSNGKVTIYNDVPYAPPHNFGGTLHPRVTPKMRRFAWAKYFAAAGIPKGGASPEKGRKKGKTAAPVVSEEAEMWKRMALTRKTTLNINIPQRKFLGESKDLTAKVRTMMQTEIEKILKNGNTLS